VNLRQNWSRAKGLQEQLESILEFSADQNNAQVKTLNKRFSDLVDQHEKLRANSATSSYSYDQLGSMANPKHFQELVKQLTINIGETERELKESQERGLMSLEERLSKEFEYNSTKSELAQIKHLLAEKEAARALEIQSLKSELEKEKCATNTSRSETKIFQSRLDAIMNTVQILGLDITKQTASMSDRLTSSISLVILEIIPVGPHCDLVMLWTEVRENYVVQGVVWGDTYEIKEVQNGLNVLQMPLTIDESEVTIETVIAGIESLDDWVLSTKILTTTTY